MVTLDESIIARLKAHGKTFEVFVEPEGALAFKKGDSVKIENILAVEEVFEDAKNGDRPAEQDVINAFGTNDVLKIAEKIIYPLRTSRLCGEILSTYFFSIFLIFQSGAVSYSVSMVK